MFEQPTHPFVVRQIEPGEEPLVLALAKSLPEFFPDDFVELIGLSLQDNVVLIGELDNKAVGFIVYTKRDAQTAEIIWIGVKSEYHGLGLGTLMLDTLERKLDEEGFKKLIASTLSYTVKYKPYEKVRTFFYHRGFTSLGIQNNYYQDGLDRLLLVKHL